MPSVAYKHQRLWFIKLVIVIFFAQRLAGPVIVARADEPQPDPAGIATGDKTSTSDAGGNSFMLKPCAPSESCLQDLLNQVSEPGKSHFIPLHSARSKPHVR